MTEELRNVLGNFRLDSPPESCERYGCGHINETYLVVCASGRRYILQKISRAFKDVEGLMRNISSVLEHIRAKCGDPRGAMTIVRTTGDKSYYHCEKGDWRVYDFIEGSICLQKPRCPEDFYESAKAFGNFQQQLSDFPAETLTESIPNFHNTPDRYRIFREILEKDPMGRAAGVKAEIEFALKREEEAGILIEMLKKARLPLRVTHNDTKLNNVMLDAATGKALCVIDLDTVMPGLSLYDFGDSIRFGAATAPEDERDLAKVSMDLNLFETYTAGFLKACPGLEENERKLLPMGAKIMTLECGVRFLSDYLDGDNYFAVHREGQNLDRCRSQFKLVADMEGKLRKMQNIVEKFSE